MLLVDLLVLMVLGLYGYFGYRRGFISGLAELVALLLGLVIAFLLYKPLGGVIFDTFHLPRGLSDLFGFLAIWAVLEGGLSLAWHRLSKRIPKDLTDKPANRFAGIVPGVFKGIVLVVILLLVVATSPIPATAKDPIIKSTFGRLFLGVGTTFQQQFNNLFGQALRDTLAFKTIKTGTNESSSLGFTDADPKICADDEDRMLDLVNQERRKAGLRTVGADSALREVARAHSKDMLARGYFSHVNPDGLDPFDRMYRANITYVHAGENLAFAPTVEIAHTGLMNSPGHRDNILKLEFSRLGVGCLDAGIRGKMFSQEFTG